VAEVLRESGRGKGGAVELALDDREHAAVGALGDELALHEALAELDTVQLEVDAALLVNVNTPDDLRRIG